MKALLSRTTFYFSILNIFVFFISIFTACCPADGINTDFKVLSKVSLGLEKPGIQIEKVEFNSRYRPAPTAIHLTSQNGKSMLRSLTQLTGLVQINSAVQALHYVRFRTSREYLYDWNGSNIPLEIVSFKQSHMRSYADTGWQPGRTSGCAGVLSDQAYRTGKFQPPDIKLLNKRYQIIRWVCIYSGLRGKAVQKWQELVGEDGKYNRIVLKSMPSPKLPDTTWFIPGPK